AEHSPETLTRFVKCALVRLVPVQGGRQGLQGRADGGDVALIKGSVCGEGRRNLTVWYACTIFAHDGTAWVTGTARGCPPRAAPFFPRRRRCGGLPWASGAGQATPRAAGRRAAPPAQPRQRLRARRRRSGRGSARPAGSPGNPRRRRIFRSRC